MTIGYLYELISGDLEVELSKANCEGANNSSNENGGGSGGLLGAISNIGSNIPGFTDLIGGYANHKDDKHYTNEKKFNPFMYRTQTMSEVVTKSHVGDLQSIDDTSYNI